MPNIRAGVLLILCLGGLQPRQRGPVYVTASFVDKNNLFIESLSNDEVQVLENGQVRRIEFCFGLIVTVLSEVVFRSGSYVLFDQVC